MDNTRTILITGGNGYVGSNLVQYFEAAGYKVFFTNRNDGKDAGILKVDIASNSQVKTAIGKVKPDIIIHTAALSSLKLCEADPEQADLINFTGTKNIVDAVNASAPKCKLIFLSSDYVFDGSKGNYTEKSAKSPQTVYGQSKLKAEKYILENIENSIIIRTANIFGRGGNFFNFILKSLQENQTVEVFSDVYFTPTNIDFLADSISALIEKDYRGVIHLAGRERVSRYEFASKIAKAYGLSASLIKKSKQPSSGTIAPDSSLNTSKLEKLLGLQDMSLEKHLNYLSGNLIKPYFSFTDERGQILGISQGRKWLEVNFLSSKKGCVRGGHYHQKTKEAFYFISGKLKISYHNINTGEMREFIAEAGDIAEIPLLTMHTFEIIEDTSWINMLSIPMKGDDKDFHKI